MKPESSSLKPPPALAFGTYRVPSERARNEVARALERGIRRIDTAQLYGNEVEVFAAVRDFEATRPDEEVHVTSKIRKNLHFDDTLRAVESSVGRLGRPLDMMLLHRPLPQVMWRALDRCVERGLLRAIGVSSYNLPRLSALLSICQPLDAPDEAGCRRPALLQMEAHPFVGPIQQMLSFCRTQGIAVQGHTLLARGMFLDFPPLVRLAKAHGVSPAVLLLRWACQLGVGVLFHTSREDHLDEVMTEVLPGPALPARDMAEISGYHCIVSRRFFTEALPPLVDPALDAITDTDAYVAEVAARLAADRAALARDAPVSETAMALPHQTNWEILFDPLAQRIAETLFPPEGAASVSHQRYRDLLRRLRARCVAAATTSPKRKSCTVDHGPPAASPIVVAGRPVSRAVALPAAMPVEVAPLEELQPFFDFLATPDRFFLPGTAPHPLTFPRGTYFPDQRMDLCKQVVGPAHVGRLADALVAQAEAQVRHPVRHFLLGNNIACDGDDPEAAAALARIAHHPGLAIETWYLAGNGLGPRAMEVIADALGADDRARALWLKRNPLGPAGALHVGRLLGANRRLELLDLHNTGLFDEGLEALAEGVAGRGLALRHLYLSANALTHRAVESLGAMLESKSLVSLYLSMNRLGTPGSSALVELIARGRLGALERLDVGANGLDATCLEGLAEVLIQHCPRLRFLDLGTYRATRDLGEEPNRLGGGLSPLCRLLEHPRLEALGLAAVGLGENERRGLVEAARPGQSLVGVEARGIQHERMALQRLRQPLRVVDIESVYRGRA
ncbi:MAG: aldo/keto reductase [Myxococcales bacterium]|nr:aldo/keto reductase [Myxococcales bacterium]